MVYLRKVHVHRLTKRFTARAKQEHAEDWIRDIGTLKDAPHLHRMPAMTAS